MTKEQQLAKAIEIAQKAHAGQTDKFDQPYIGHVFRVMNYGKTLDEKIVGVLHDVVEDNPDYSFEFLKSEGFPENVVFAVECLTKRENEAYDDYITRVQQSPLAISVKLNDLRDNMDLRRFHSLITERDHTRLNKYLKAYLFLKENY